MQKDGRKYDGGKLRYDLIPVLALEEVTRVITLGAEKYDPENWKRVPEGRRRYTAAAFRHIEAWRKGEVTDEIGTHHIANAISNLMFILEKELRGWEDVAAVQSEKKLLKMWCDTCEGVGHYDNRGLGIPRELYNPECPCPDCDGNGYIEVVTSENKPEKISETVRSERNALPPPMENEYYNQGCWYPDNSGEWIEYDGSGQPVEDNVIVEVLLQYERDVESWNESSLKACKFEWDWGNTGDAKIVAYKIVK